MIEFKFVDAVPAALARDRKKLDTHVINVSALWRSTLYVTNLHGDDESIRALFSQHGQVLDTRWPSLKYKATRRFCYVTMDSSVSRRQA